MATLLCQLTKTQHELLAQILAYAANASDPAKSIFKVTRVVTTVKDFEKLYIIGPNSILCNLPHPVAKSSPDKRHAYVTLTDVLANEFAARTSFDNFYFDGNVKVEQLIENPKTLSTTTSAYNLFFSMREEELPGTDSIVYLWLKEWRDDFDPNNTKASRNQVWINTYTICPPTTEKKGKNTYFMAISGKGTDHSPIESIFGNEIEKLAKEGAYFYSGTNKKMIKVKVGKLITCVDRPERTSMFQMGSHNGKYSAYFGYAGFVDGECKLNHLPSCPECRKRRLNTLFHQSASILNENDTRCQNNKCSNWNVMDSQFYFPAPPFYPTSYDTGPDAIAPPCGRVVNMQDVFIPKSPSIDIPRIPSNLNQIIENDVIITNSGNTLPLNQTISNLTTFVTPANVSTILDAEIVHRNIESSIVNAITNELVDYTRPVITRKKKRARRSITSPISSINKVESSQRLPTVVLTVDWLKEAIMFAAHNITAKQPLKPNQAVGSYYWGKGNFGSYLLSCGITQKLIDVVYDCARNKPLQDPIPHTWYDKHALKKCHYAAMHMLFLGHAKSNYDMTASWLRGNGLLTNFGEQVNKYMISIQQLRCHKYYNSHTLSSSSWGTGTWVSENYLFWSRTQKFWFVLPCLLNSKQMQKEDKRDRFINELRMIHRFTSACQAAMSCIMSSERSIPNMSLLIKIYMDTMVEIDNLIKGFNTGKNKRANFVKSNSLGILSAADSHDYLGPATLHWEGGYSGERKIQEVKPFLKTKRANANWQLITLRRLYQLDSLSKVLETLTLSNTVIGTNASPNAINSNRDSEGILKIYSNCDVLQESVNSFNPLSGIVDTNNNVWIACRPRQAGTRSSVVLNQVIFEDNAGRKLGNLCWMTPIHVNVSTTKILPSMKEVMKIAKEYILLLPSLNQDGLSFINLYYSIGSKWSERTPTGFFEPYNITEALFDDW